MSMYVVNATVLFIMSRNLLSTKKVNVRKHPLLPSFANRSPNLKFGVLFCGKPNTQR